MYMYVHLNNILHEIRHRNFLLCQQAKQIVTWEWGGVPLGKSICFTSYCVLLLAYIVTVFPLACT